MKQQKQIRSSHSVFVTIDELKKFLRVDKEEAYIGPNVRPNGTTEFVFEYVHVGNVEDVGN